MQESDVSAVVHNMNVCKRVLFFTIGLLKQQMLMECLFCLIIARKEILKLKLHILFSTLDLSGEDLLNHFFNIIKTNAVILIVVANIFTNMCLDKLIIGF